MVKKIDWYTYLKDIVKGTTFDLSNLIILSFVKFVKKILSSPSFILNKDKLVESK